MDVSNIASLSSAMASQAVGDAVGISVLKKAMDIQASDALQLIAAIPPAPSITPTLGNNINVTA